MPTHEQHPRFQEMPGTARVYSPYILPRLQSLLADLADIDFACEKSLEAIERSSGDEGLKRTMIAELRRRHQERRAPYVGELEDLQEQVRACFA
jgi:hypothetical protein